MEDMRTHLIRGYTTIPTEFISRLLNGYMLENCMLWNGLLLLLVQNYHIFDDVVQYVKLNADAPHRIV